MLSFRCARHFDVHFSFVGDRCMQQPSGTTRSGPWHGWWDRLVHVVGSLHQLVDYFVFRMKAPISVQRSLLSRRVAQSSLLEELLDAI